MEHGCRMMYAVCPSFFGLGLENGHVPFFGFYCSFVEQTARVKIRKEGGANSASGQVKA